MDRFPIITRQSGRIQGPRGRGDANSAGRQPTILPNFQKKNQKTRMHSSKMHTARSSTPLGADPPRPGTPPWEQTP